MTSGIPAPRPASHLYYVKSWTPSGFGGASETQQVEVQAFAKVATPDRPYVVVNELVAGRLGALVGLPVPPGAIVPASGGAASWMTMSFLPVPGALPPVDPATVYASHPHLCAGVVAFDLLIANRDRHAGNLVVTTGPVLHAGGPVDVSRLEIFDHSHALLYAQPTDVPAYLTNARGKFVIAGTDGDLAGARCAVLDHLTSVQDFWAWCDRIRAILNDGLIDETCAEAAMITTAFDATDSAALANFLKHRRDNLRDLSISHRAEFKGIPDGAWPTT